ncbi:hypothetical protein RF11_06748 [Thelohanellus kitauei]|uniref:Uncharacterized protein n=1 Tax=Thelohanellus kitauei TaxID=669202 RepID=A0A0C2MM63_THEKT|nr:hypothetical protein RF11_06748 [Thelohanellus kitauei]
MFFQIQETLYGVQFIPFRRLPELEHLAGVNGRIQAFKEDNSFVNIYSRKYNESNQSTSHNACRTFVLVDPSFCHQSMLVKAKNVKSDSGEASLGVALIIIVNQRMDLNS